MPPKNFKFKQKPYFSFCMFILFQFTQMLPIKINRISCTAIPLRPDVVVEIAALLKKVSCCFWLNPHSLFYEILKFNQFCGMVESFIQLQLECLRVDSHLPKSHWLSVTDILCPKRIVLNKNYWSVKGKKMNRKKMVNLKMYGFFSSMEFNSRNCVVKNIVNDFN